MLRKLSRIISAALAAVLSATTSLNAVEYTFANIADSSDSRFTEGFLAFGYGRHPGSHIALNDFGEVAFFANLSGVYRADRYTTVPIATIQQGFTSWVVYGPVGALSINNHGQVSFIGGTHINGLEPTYGVWISNGPVRTLITEAGNPGLPSVQSYTPINRHGEVAFTKRIGDGPFTGMYLGDGESNVQYFESGSGSTEFDRFHIRSLNDHGGITFFGQLSPFFTEYWTFVGVGPGLVELVAQAGFHFEHLTPFDPVHGPATELETLTINYYGEVAFWALSFGGEEGYFRGSSGNYSNIATESDGFSSFGHWVDDSHTVILRTGYKAAFLAETTAGVQGIFHSDDLTIPIIAIGDELFGSTVLQLILGHEGFNNLGQVAFHAQLADGRQVIARADPVGMPCYLDLDHNGTIGPGDVGFLKDNFGCDATIPACARYDFDENGAVGPGDVGYVKNRFGLCP